MGSGWSEKIPIHPPIPIHPLRGANVKFWNSWKKQTTKMTLKTSRTILRSVWGKLYPVAMVKLPIFVKIHFLRSIWSILGYSEPKFSTSQWYPAKMFKNGYLLTLWFSSKIGIPKPLVVHWACCYVGLKKKQKSTSRSYLAFGEKVLKLENR